MKTHAVADKIQIMSNTNLAWCPSFTAYSRYSIITISRLFPKSSYLKIWMVQLWMATL